MDRKTRTCTSIVLYVMWIENVHLLTPPHQHLPHTVRQWVKGFALNVLESFEGYSGMFLHRPVKDITVHSDTQL